MSVFVFLCCLCFRYCVLTLQPNITGYGTLSTQVMSFVFDVSILCIVVCALPGVKYSFRGVKIFRKGACQGRSAP